MQDVSAVVPSLFTSLGSNLDLGTWWASGPRLPVDWRYKNTLPAVDKGPFMEILDASNAKRDAYTKSTRRTFVQKYQWHLENEVENKPTYECDYGFFMFTTNANSEYGVSAAQYDSEALILNNMTARHGGPLFVNKFYNAVAKSQGKKGDRIVYTQALPMTNRERQLRVNESVFQFTFFIIVAFSFVSIFGLVFIVFEKEAEVKLHQFINSVEIKVYWLSNLAWDSAMYLPAISSALFVLWLIDVELIFNAKILPSYVGVLLLFSVAMPAFGYIFSHTQKSADAAMSVAIFMNLMMAIALFLVFLIFYFGNGALKRLIHYNGYWLRLWPVYALGEALAMLTLMGFAWLTDDPDKRPDGYWEKCHREYYEFNSIGARMKHECARTAYDWEFGVGMMMGYLVVEAVVYTGLVILIDWLQQNVKYRQKLNKMVANRLRDDPINLRERRDDDVVAEEDRVESLALLDEKKKATGLFAKNLNKTFRMNTGNCIRPHRTQVNAVRDVSIALEKGEVMGLLGANGAGKTTTFRMMCGIEVPDENAGTEILTNGASIFNERGKCRRMIGYTSQCIMVLSPIKTAVGTFDTVFIFCSFFRRLVSWCILFK